MGKNCQEYLACNVLVQFKTVVQPVTLAGCFYKRKVSVNSPFFFALLNFYRKSANVLSGYIR